MIAPMKKIYFIIFISFQGIYIHLKNQNNPIDSKTRNSQFWNRLFFHYANLF